MAIFSLGRDDDEGTIDEGPSNNPNPTPNPTSRAPKKIRTEIPLRPTAPAPAPAVYSSTTNGAELSENDMREDSVEGEEEDDVEDVEEGDEDREEEDEEYHVGEEGDYENESEEEVEDEDEDEDEDVTEGAEEIGGNTENGGGLVDLVGANSGGAVSVTLTDPDVLDCPICLESLTIPVFQCENGHIACTSCCIRISNKCPSCSWPIGYNRCRAIEKVIESVKISCRYLEYGCKETMLYSKKNDHEDSCTYLPCSCPLEICNFVGSSKNLYAHFGGRHFQSASHFHFNSFFPVYVEKGQKCVILQEQTEGVIFILNHSNERLGSAVNLICIGPAPTKKGFYCEIVSRDGDNKLILQSFAECMPKWSAYNPIKKYLLVPSDFLQSGSRIKLEICISKYYGGLGS